MGKAVWKPGTVLYPVPAVMVSCGTMEEKNIITVAWTGTVNSDPAMTYISVRPGRHSYGLVEQTGEFVINLVTEQLAYARPLSAKALSISSAASHRKFLSAHTACSLPRSFPSASVKNISTAQESSILTQQSRSAIPTERITAWVKSWEHSAILSKNKRRKSRPAIAKNRIPPADKAAWLKKTYIFLIGFLRTYP